MRGDLINPIEKVVTHLPGVQSRSPQLAIAAARISGKIRKIRGVEQELQQLRRECEDERLEVQRLADREYVESELETADVMCARSALATDEPHHLNSDLQAVELRMAALVMAAETKSMHASMNLGTGAQVAAQSVESCMREAFAVAVGVPVNSLAFTRRLAAAKDLLKSQESASRAKQLKPSTKRVSSEFGM